MGNLKGIIVILILYFIKYLFNYNKSLLANILSYINIDLYNEFIEI